MSDTDIHSCGYYCDRPDCIKAQRDELRQKLFSDQAVKTYSGGKPNYTQPIEKEWVGLTDEEIDEGAKQSWVSQQAFESAVWWAMEVLKEKNT
jgi:hypothetical protein